MSPELVQNLARRHPNLILFKDTSGRDGVALAAMAGLDLGRLFLMRGAEGGYADHLKANGGAYDGFLLSTASSFGEQLYAIIELSLAGRREEAEELSSGLSSLVAEVFRLVEDISVGNVFANAGKAVDHTFAHGPRALDAPPPRLHGGGAIPHDALAATRDALAGAMRRSETSPRNQRAVAGCSVSVGQAGDGRSVASFPSIRPLLYSCLCPLIAPREVERNGDLMLRHHHHPQSEGR